MTYFGNFKNLQVSSKYTNTFYATSMKNIAVHISYVTSHHRKPPSACLPIIYPSLYPPATSALLPHTLKHICPQTLAYVTIAKPPQCHLEKDWPNRTRKTEPDLRYFIRVKLSVNRQCKRLDSRKEKSVVNQRI